MSRRQTSPYANPFALWTALATTTNEMLFASSQVIAHRTQLMARAGATPNASEQREMKRMIDEKTSAVVASASAMSTRTGQILAASTSQMFAQMAAGSSLFFDLATGAATGRMAATQSRTMSKMVNDSGRNATQMSTAAAQIASAGIEPFHKRATSNAKRLRKR